jgi:hypothetical protein
MQFSLPGRVLLGNVRFLDINVHFAASKAGAVREDEDTIDQPYILDIGSYEGRWR